jgi:hypothetical protein
MVRLQHFSDPAVFYEHVEPFLLRREAEHNLILGICTELIRNPDRYPEPPYLAAAERDARVVGVAVRTPPYNLLLSHQEEPDALDLIAADAMRVFGSLPGVNSRHDTSADFARRWEAASSQTARVGMAQRIYQLSRVIPVGGVAGAMRPARPAEHDLLCEWMGAFQAEAVGATDPAQVERLIDLYLRSEIRGLFIWEDPEPVSMAGFAGPTPNGIRIGAVYTPPEYRRRGYASANVAALSQSLLDRGYRFCFLYTDLSNPTSNKIYMDIGYEPVCDVTEYRFE